MIAMQDLMLEVVSMLGQKTGKRRVATFKGSTRAGAIIRSAEGLLYDTPKGKRLCGKMDKCELEDVSARDRLGQ